MVEEKISPIEAPKPPAVNPLASATSAHAATLKLKPVIRKPVIGGAKSPLKMPSKPSLTPAATPVASEPAPSAPIEQLKSMTQKLKGVTQQIPQQAILHKTGIIAEQQLTDAQKESSKSRTARISLSDAIGAAPVQSESAPMKTIRIKRPVDLSSGAAAPKPTATFEASAAPAASAGKDPSLTQRKTLKISRPGIVRPSGKFTAPQKTAPAADAPAETDVADIPDIPEIAPAKVSPVVVSSREDDGGVPQGLLVVDCILQFAACVAIAFLGVLLYLDLNKLWF